MTSRRGSYDWMAFSILVAGALLLQPASRAAESPAPSRRPWNTSRVTGSPDPPPPFQVVRAFPHLKFDKPLLMARCAASNRLFVGEQSGVLYSFANQPAARAELFCDLRKELRTVHLHPEAKDVESVYGLAFHPNFAANRQCYVCYTLRSKRGEANLPDGTRVSRFLVTDADPPRIDPASEEIVLTFLQGGHNGGDLHFGPDGMLYISTGDAASPNPPDPLHTGQDISDLLSSILRIDVDRRDPGKNYAIPRDNPFVDLAGARPEVWAYGFRNPWRMSFDRQTGNLFVGDVGWELWEMVHRVERGGNYGWSATEGPQPIKTDQAGPTPIQPPLIELSHTVACSITGGYVYRGQKFPELQGAYVFGDWETKRLWAARVGGNRLDGNGFEGNSVQEMPEIAEPSVRIVSFGEDNQGELYFLDYDQGTLHTLARNDTDTQNRAFPRTLSQTGLFASVPDHQWAEGVIPFSVNARQWLDGATAEHFVALPGESSVELHASGKPVPGLVNWHHFRMHFPQDAVLGRTLRLGPVRLETQILHFAGGDWRGYTYVWRDDQSDADLAPHDGMEKEIRVGTERRLWQVHSRSQCLSCHSNQSEYALAFLPEQLNRALSSGPNQLVALTQAGVIRRMARDGRQLPPFDADSVVREPKVADPADDDQPLASRARGYLHANCGHCHSDHGGGAVPLRLQFQVPEEKLHAIGVRPTRGDFGLPGAEIIRPGDPYASTLYFRMAKFGRDHMPHLGAELPDEEGLALVERWIASLKADAIADSAPASVQELVGRLNDSRSAMKLARSLGRGEIAPADRAAVVAAAAAMDAGPLRDLLEGYLPADGGPRKLGQSPRPRTILAHPGDADRGEQLYWSERVNCGKCHRVQGRGTAVGPDLTTIGSSRSRDELLESLLVPSRRIDPKFATYIALTDDGLSVSGVLVRRDSESVVLRDSQGEGGRARCRPCTKVAAVPHVAHARRAIGGADRGGSGRFAGVPGHADGPAGRLNAMIWIPSPCRLERAGVRVLGQAFRRSAACPFRQGFAIVDGGGRGRRSRAGLAADGVSSLLCAQGLGEPLEDKQPRSRG